MYETREAWLEAAVEELKPLFANIGVELPKVRVSVGWPSKGGTATKGKVVGQCWNSKASKDGVAQIFVSPTMGDDLVATLGVVCHELIHAWDDCKNQHKGPFLAKFKLIGLVGKATCSEVGENLREVLTKIIEKLGEFPHSALDPFEMAKQRPKQTTRMLKLSAPDCCDYTVRTTQKWIDEGLPKCPHDVTMELAD